MAQPGTTTELSDSSQGSSWPMYVTAYQGDVFNCMVHHIISRILYGFGLDGKSKLVRYDTSSQGILALVLMASLTQTKVIYTCLSLDGKASRLSATNLKSNTFYCLVYFKTKRVRNYSKSHLLLRCWYPTSARKIMCRTAPRYGAKGTQTMWS